MVRFPPNDMNDAVGWSRALLSDLAGHPHFAAELLQAVWDVQSGRFAEWSVGYNVYGIEVLPGGATVRFLEDAAPVPLDVLVGVLADHLGL
ncbi:MAG TPA: hypothetical protein VGE74_27715 [Gemmata sp.]